MGETLKADLFAQDERVDVTGKSRGRGFAGVMKRHGFGGGRATHGSMFHRAPGSIGQSAWPSRVFKGMRGPGHMGDRKTTTKNLKVVRVDAENNLLYIKGAVPGAPNSYVTIKRSRKGKSAAKRSPNKQWKKFIPSWASIATDTIQPLRRQSNSVGQGIGKTDFRGT